MHGHTRVTVNRNKKATSTLIINLNAIHYIPLLRSESITYISGYIHETSIVRFMRF